MKVARVMPVNPLRAELTLPENFISPVRPKPPVNFEGDASPGRQFTAQVLYVSPALEANQRALVVEASVPNPTNELKPGLFATARIEQPNRTPAVVIPASSVRTTAGTSRVYVVTGDHVEERIVT